MIPLVRAETMREIDRAAIERLGVPSLDLMEAAGRGVAEAAAAHLGGAGGQRVLVVSGRGNNGGDGLVAARYLAAAGASVTVVVAGAAGDDALSPDARANAVRWREAGGEVRFLGEKTDVSGYFSDGPECDLVIDALLGTGSHGAPRGAVAAAVRGIGAMDAPALAVDIPSGVDADTGEAPGEAVRAALTVTLALPKRGHYLFPGRALAGSLEIVDIGIPPRAVAEVDVDDFVPEAADVASYLPAWEGDAHKGTRGRLLVVGGSEGLTGAVALAATAALRAGAGLVTAGVPAGLGDILEAKLTEVMTLPLPEERGRRLSPAALEAIREFDQGRLSAMVVGSGMSRHEGPLELVRSLVADFACPKVLDADGLLAFRARPELLRPDAAAGALVLTPHPGEAAWLIDKSVDEINAGRIDLAVEWAQENGQVLVLKGAPTVVASPEGEAFVNPTGGPALATGGTGDVLAGLIGGFLAQGVPPLRAALLGVYLHGFTADLIGERRSRHGMVAGDLLEALPEAMSELSGALA